VSAFHPFLISNNISHVYNTLYLSTHSSLWKVLSSVCGGQMGKGREDSERQKSGAFLITRWVIIVHVSNSGMRGRDWSEENWKKPSLICLVWANQYWSFCFLWEILIGDFSESSLFFLRKVVSHSVTNFMCYNPVKKGVFQNNVSGCAKLIQYHQQMVSISK
jgi:hypothetical protein